MNATTSQLRKKSPEAKSYIYDCFHLFNEPVVRSRVISILAIKGFNLPAYNISQDNSVAKLTYKSGAVCLVGYFATVGCRKVESSGTAVEYTYTYKPVLFK